MMTPEEWLRKYLRFLGPAESHKVMADARAAGYTKAEIRRAKSELHVQTENDFDTHTHHAKTWRWRLPDDERKRD